MAGKGGKRPGAGRKKGGTNIKRIAVKTINEGVLPLEMVLKTARRMWDEATDANGDIKSLPKAKAAAQFAAPAMQYTSSRLQAISHSIVPGQKNPAVQSAEDAVRRARELLDNARRKATKSKG